MSPVYRPEMVPPKLDRFCYLSHPAQRVMAALYSDYLQRKQDILQCQASKSSANENYYQSIYQSRFGSAPNQRHASSTVDVAPITSQSDSTFRMAYPDMQVTATNFRMTKRPSTDYPPDTPNAIECPSIKTKQQSTDHGPNDIECPLWMSSDTSTYSDSPPIETQAYRILSQFQPEDFSNYPDILSNEANMVNVLENVVIASTSLGNVGTSKNMLDTGTRSHSIDRETSSFDCNETLITSEDPTSPWCETDTISDKAAEVSTLPDGPRLSEQGEETVYESIDGSQSLFSQDEDQTDKDPGLSVKLQKRQGGGRHTKKCARMQQLHERNIGDKASKEHQTLVKTNTVNTDIIEHESIDVRDQDIINVHDISSFKRPVTNKTSIVAGEVNHCELNFGSANSSVTDIDCRGDARSASVSYLQDKHTIDNHDKSKTNLDGTLGGKLKRLAVGDFHQQETVNCKDSHTDEENTTEMESPFTEKTPGVYSVFRGDCKARAPKHNEVRSVDEQSKASEKRRKTSNCFAVPFKKPRLPSLPRLDTIKETHTHTTKEASLVDTDRMSVTELQQLLSEILASEEVIIILVYKDGSTQLRHTLFQQDTKRKNIGKGKQNDVEIECLAISSNCLQHRSVFTFPVKARDQHHDLEKDFWCQLLKGQARKIGFHVKETLAAVIKIYKLNVEKVDTTWTVLDPSIGLWLLDPDKPVTGFEAVLHALCLPEQVPSKDCLDVLYEDMMLLGVAMEKLSQKLKSKDMWDLFICVETKLTTVLAGMELRTLHIATHTLIKFSEILKKKLKKLEQKAHQAAGHAFLLSSHAQLRQVLFEELRLDMRLPQKTKLAKTNVGRETSTSETVLTQLSPFHDLPRIVLEYRQLQKLKSTYIDGILSCIQNECLTTHWDQTAAATGRLTSFHPNIQAIPKLPVTISGYQDHFIADKDVNDEIQIYARDSFISRPGYSLVAADFQQIELRLLAHLAADPVLLRNFKDADNPDIFNVLTAQWLGKAIEDISSSEREQTKRVVYSVMYGAGKEKLAEYLKISPDNAKAIMSSFLTKFPSVGQFTKKCVEFCQKHGYTTSIFKRRRLFPNIKHPSSWLRAQAERQCVNFCIQGSAADICKAAMIQIENALTTNGDLQAQLLVQIHDELLLEVADEDMQKLIEIIQDVMQCHEKLCGSMVKLQVPLPVSISVGKTWGQMKVVETF